MLAGERISKLDFDFVDHLISKGWTFNLGEIRLSIKTGNLDMIKLITENSVYGVNRYAESIFLSGSIEVVEHFREDVIAHAYMDLSYAARYNSLEFLKYVLETELYVITGDYELIGAFCSTSNIEKIKVIWDFTPKDRIDHRATTVCFMNCDCEIWEYFYGDIEFDEIYTLFWNFIRYFNGKYDFGIENTFNILEHIYHTREFTGEEREKIHHMVVYKKFYDIVMKGEIEGEDFVEW